MKNPLLSRSASVPRPLGVSNPADFSSRLAIISTIMGIVLVMSFMSGIAEAQSGIGNVAGTWTDTFGYLWTLTQSGSSISGTTVLNFYPCNGQILSVTGTASSGGFTLTASSPTSGDAACPITSSFTYAMTLISSGVATGSWNNYEQSGPVTMTRTGLYVATTDVPTGTVGQEYRFCFAANPSQPSSGTYEWKITWDSIPSADFYYNSTYFNFTGCLENIPDEAGSFPFSVTVQDSSGNVSPPAFFTMQVTATTPEKASAARLANDFTDLCSDTSPSFETGTAQLVGAGIEGAIDCGLALYYARVAGDPPDPNFTAIAQPVPFPFVMPTSGWPANVSNSFTELLTDEAEIFGFGQAALISTERAQGAQAAGNVYWQKLQSQAASQYDELMSQKMLEYAPLARQFKAAYSAAGLPPIVFTPAEIGAVSQALPVLPQNLVKSLTAAGLTPLDTAFLARLLTARDISSTDVGLFTLEGQESTLLTTEAQNFSLPLGPATPSGGTECNGVYYGLFSGDITVSTGQTCVFTAGGVTGNVTMTGGDLVLSNTSIGRNVAVNGGGAFALGWSTTINGNLQIQNLPSGSAQNQVCGASIGGNLQFQNNGTAVIIGSPSSPCPGNMINGNLLVQNNTAASVLYSNTVIGNLEDDNNFGATQIFSNTIKLNLQCQDNSAITGGMNTARQTLGQCASF